MKAYTPDEAGNPGPVFGGAFEVDEELDYAGICDDVFSWEGMTFCHVFVFQKKTSTFSIFHFLHTKLNIRKKNITINIESISCFFFNPDASTFDFESFRARFSKTLGRGLEIFVSGKIGSST